MPFSPISVSSPPVRISKSVRNAQASMICNINHISKGQLISECLFEKIVWTKIPTKNLIDSAHYTCWAESIKFFVGILVQTIFSKRHSEINWPLDKATICQSCDLYNFDNRDLYIHYSWSFMHKRSRCLQLCRSDIAVYIISYCTYLLPNFWGGNFEMITCDIADYWKL